MGIDNTNFFSYIYSSWVTTYLWKAYRSGLTVANIPTISSLDSCSSNIRKFENLWNEELRQRGPTSASLVLVAWKFVRLRVIISCIFNVSSQIMRFILYTILLRKLLEYSENADKAVLNGIQWIVYAIAFDVVQIILDAWSNIMNQRTALRLKSSCLSLLFKKMIHSNNIVEMNEGELMNILLNDGRKIYDAVNFGTSVVNGPVVALSAVIYVSIWLQPLALIGLIVFLFFYLLQNRFKYLVNYCTRTASDFASRRMQKIIEIIDDIKLIKINGWEENFIKNLSSIRSIESQWLLKSIYLTSFNSSMNNAMPFIAIIATFFPHFLTSRHLSHSIALPICIIFIGQLNDAFASTRKSLHCIKESIKIFRKMKNGLLLEDTSSHVSKPFEPSQAVVIINASFAYNIYRDEKYDSKTIGDSAEFEDKKNAGDDSRSEKEHLASSFPRSRRREILSNITFKARKGQLIGIYGTPRSGKSSLLLAALGQMRITSGQLMRQGSCAYVGQRPWLGNATVRENILFGEAHDAKRYYEAQLVCKLKQDIDELPDGDEFRISNGNRNGDISRILKQKIVLARAFYADRDIYFLDDPLSCMDDALAEEIFDDLIIRALAEKTIIFVTSELKYINRCDYMYILRDGKIAEHGRHKELMRLGREYALLVKSAIIDAEGDYSDESCTLQENGPRGTKENNELSIADIHNDNDFSLKVQNYSGLLNKTDVKLQRTILTMYYNYIKPYGGLSLLLPVTLIYIFFTNIGLISLFVLIWSIDAINTVDNENNGGLYISWYGFCFLFLILACLIKSFVVQYASNKVADKLHNALLNKLMYATDKLPDAASFHAIKNVFLQELNNVSLVMPPVIDNALTCIVILLCNFFVLTSAIAWFNSFIVIVSVLFFAIGKIFRAANTNTKGLESTLILPYYEFIDNSLEGLITIRTFKKENDLLRKFQNLIDNNNACYFFDNISEQWLSIRLQILTTACLFVAAFCVILLKDSVSPGIAGLTFIYVIQIPSIIQKCLKYLSKAESYFSSIQNISDYVHITNSTDKNDVIAAIVPDSKWPTTGLIRFDNVRLTNTDDTFYIFNNICFTITNAEKIGILSKSNIYKSSLVDVFYKLCELNSGNVYIDSVDISQIDIKHLRNQISLIPEKPIFYGTIRFFLDPKKRYTDATIWNALERVNLKDKISSVASQLHCLIVEKSFNIYEKQLLFFARALLHKNKILLWQENATSEPQEITFIHQILEKEFSHTTVFVLGHYINTVLPCDRVLIIDEGRVLEFDDPTALMNNQESNLRKMWSDEETDKDL